MSLFKSTMWLITAEIIFTLSGYVINAGLGRLLGPIDYGRYSLVIGFTTMLLIFVGRSVPTAMAKRLSEHANDNLTQRAIVRTAALIQSGIIIALTILFYLVAPLIAHSFGDHSLTPLFKLSALIIPAFALSSFHVLFFNGTKRFGAMTVLKMSRGLFRMLWVLALAYYFNLTGALTGAIIAPLCVFGIALLIDAFWTPRTTAQHKILTQHAFTYSPRKILSYAGGFMLFTFFYEFYIRTDIYLIKAILGDDAATGIYNAAMTVALIPYYLLFALAFMLFPTISERTKNGITTDATILIRTVLRFLFILIVPITALLIIFAQPLIILFFGTSFSASAALIPLMIGGTLFGTFFYIFAAVLNGAGYTRTTTTITATAIVASVAANLTLLPRYGITATALIFSTTSCAMGITILWSIAKYFGASLTITTVMRVIIATTVSSAVAIALTHTSLFFVLNGVLSLGVYIALLIAMRELTHADYAIIKIKK